MSLAVDRATSLAERVAELEEQLHVVQARHRLLRRANAVRDRLTTAVVEGGDETEIAAIVADALGKPCAITGTHLAVVAGTWRPALLDPGVRDDPTVQELLSTLSASDSVLLPPVLHLDARHRLLVSAPTPHGLRLWLGECGGAFTALDRAALHHASAALALLWAGVPLEIAPVSGLLAGGYDEHVLHRWCRLLGLDPYGPIAVLPTGAVSAEAAPGAVVATDASGVAAAWRQLSALAAAQDALGTSATPAAVGPAQLLLGSGDPAAVDHYLTEVLGALRTPDRRTDHLLATLAAYFDTSQSVGRTAARLGIHENTVRYRLKRAGQVLGRDLCAPEELLAVHVAVLVLRMRGDERVS